MRTLSIIFSLFAFPLCLLAEQKLQQVQGDPSLYYYPPTSPQPKAPSGENKGEKEDGDVAQGRENAFEYNLYDRQQNRIEQQQRQQQQQYYYQQSGGNGNNDTQYRRVRKPPQHQYFNPRDE